MGGGGTDACSAEGSVWGRGLVNKKSWCDVFSGEVAGDGQGCVVPERGRD